MSTTASKNIKTKNGKIQEGSAYIIAEMACAHDGKFDNAKALIDVAIQARCDAVQLQIFNTRYNVVRNHSLLPLLESIEFTKQEWQKLVSHARATSIDVFACAYDLPSLELALELDVDGIKFNSADLVNLEMLEVVASSDKVFTLGTGASSEKEIELAIHHVLKNNTDKFVLMHGIQSFPTPVTNSNISRIETLRTTFDTLTGYADHTSGDDEFALMIDLLAFGYGACVFEKHYTLDRTLKGTDYQAALDPDKLGVYVENLKKAQTAIGVKTLPLEFTEDELRYRKFQKKKIVASNDLIKGKVLDITDVELLRTEQEAGMDASQVNAVVGRKIIKDIKAHQCIVSTDLETN